MSKRRITRRTGKAKLALTLLGVVTCMGGAAYAFAQTNRPTASTAGDPLTATSPFSRSLLIRVTPAERSVAPGERAKYVVKVRHSGRRRVRLSILDGLPASAIASYSRSSFSSKQGPRSGSTLTIDTAGVPSGGHRILLLASSGRRRAIASVNLVITSRQPANFTIAGDLSSALEPGLTVPLDLALTNPGEVDLLISGLEVSVGSIDAPLASATYPCTAEDFEVAQFSGTYGFALGSSTTSSLSQLGFPPEQMPQVTMPDRPVNQNGCKGASIHFDFSGTAGSA
jgi:hypothetical protein